MFSTDILSLVRQNAVLCGNGLILLCSDTLNYFCSVKDKHLGKLFPIQPQLFIV